MATDSPAAALLRRWLDGTVTDDDRRHTCAILCMDHRYGERFAGCYQIENAGPRCRDSDRSLDYLLRLTPDGEPLVAFWLTHDGLCGCSRVETASDDPEVVEPHTATSRRNEVRKLLSPDAPDAADFPRIREAVAAGRLVLVTGHVEVAATPRRIRVLAGETDELLGACGLPPLPEGIGDAVLPAG